MYQVHHNAHKWLVQVQTVLSNHIVSIVPAAAIGMVCGGLSIAFTVLNLKVSRLRQKLIGVCSWHVPQILCYSHCDHACRHLGFMSTSGLICFPAPPCPQHLAIDSVFI